MTDPTQESFESAFLLRKSVFTTLGTLGGSNSIASGVNAAGWIVGAGETKAGKVPSGPLKRRALS